MPESRQPTDIQITNTPVDILPSNIFYLSDDLPTVAEAAHTSVPGNLRDHYGPVVARRAYAIEHAAADVYQGRDASLLMFNVGHSTPLYHSGLIAEFNIYKVVDTKKKPSKEEVFSVVPVGQLLEMAIWMVDHDISLPQVPTVQSSAATTWFGLIAETITGELGQGSLHERVQMIKRRQRDDILNRALQDRRRSPYSVIDEVVRSFHSKKARNKRLVPAARDFLIQLQTLQQEGHPAVRFGADQHIIDGLEARIKQMERDLEENPRPFPEETPPSPTA